MACDESLTTATNILCGNFNLQLDLCSSSTMYFIVVISFGNSLVVWSIQWHLLLSSYTTLSFHNKLIMWIVNVSLTGGIFILW